MLILQVAFGLHSGGTEVMTVMSKHEGKVLAAMTFYALLAFVGCFFMSVAMLAPRVESVLAILAAFDVAAGTAGMLITFEVAE